MSQQIIFLLKLYPSCQKKASQRPPTPLGEPVPLPAHYPLPLSILALPLALCPLPLTEYRLFLLLLFTGSLYWIIAFKVSILLCGI